MSEKNQPICIPFDRKGNPVSPNDPNASAWVVNPALLERHKGQCGPEAIHEIEGERLDEWLPLEYERANGVQ